MSNGSRLAGTAHRSSSQCDDDASEEGEVVAWIRSMPHGRQDEGGCCRMVGTSLVTHPADQRSEVKHRFNLTTTCHMIFTQHTCFMGSLCQVCSGRVMCLTLN